MKNLRKIIEIILISLLTFQSLDTSKEKSTFKENPYLNYILNKKSELKYKNPFQNLNGKFLELKDLPKNDSINQKARIFSNKTIEEAYKIYEKENKIREEYKDILRLFLEWDSYKKNPSEKKRADSIIKTQKLPENSSLVIKGKRRYSPEDKSYNFLLEKFDKQINYFGRQIKDPKSNVYNKKRFRNLEKFGANATDCISYMLESMTLANRKNYNLKKYSDAQKLSKFLEKNGFESIYIAENSRENIPYNKILESPQFVKDHLKNIKRENYFCKVDYLVLDSSFHNPLFQEFLNESLGFVFVQEGGHAGFLYKGEFLDAHERFDPRFLPVITSRDFYTLFDNDDSARDYQSAVIYVPKGTIEEFLKKNKENLKNRYKN